MQHDYLVMIISHLINISDLNSGIYFVRIKNGENYVTKKLIVN